MESETTFRRPGRVAKGERPRSAILEVTDRDAFLRSVRRAQEAALDAVEAFDELALWAKRLQPYFDYDTRMTVAEAVQLYLDAVRTKASGSVND